jgi:outer membrane protein TolC
MPRQLIPLGAVFALAACAPNLGPAPQPKPLGAYAAAQSLSGGAVAWPEDGWWRRYGDPQLDGLVDEALKNAPDFAQAQARLRRAQALAEQAGAAGSPTLSANAQAAEVRQSYNMGFPPEFVPKGYNDTGRVSADLNWDLDLFGRNRASLAAAVSEAEASRMDLAESRLVLTTCSASGTPPSWP